MLPKSTAWLRQASLPFAHWLLVQPMRRIAGFGIELGQRSRHRAPINLPAMRSRDLRMNIGCLEAPSIDRSTVEVVERKGLGHPDSICDALAEAFSVSLCRFYRERFDIILHHNVDKALLRGGSA